MSDSYIFAPHTPEIEKARLQQIEAAFDPTTQHWLQQAGLKVGQTCLEIGPGAGSIAQWLSEQVGDEGKVVAIDREATHWQEITAPNLEKVICDLHDWQMPTAAFDLIHARYVMIHIAQVEVLLQRLRQALKPGGVILLEEPDFSAIRLTNGTVTQQQAHQQISRAIAAMFSKKQLDPAWGQQLPHQLAAAGFALDTVEGELHLCPGSSPIAQMMARSAQVLATHYLNTEHITEASIKTYCETAENPGLWAIYYTTVRAIAHRNP